MAVAAMRRSRSPISKPWRRRSPRVRPKYGLNQGVRIDIWLSASRHPKRCQVSWGSPTTPSNSLHRLDDCQVLTALPNDDERLALGNPLHDTIHIGCKFSNWDTNDVMAHGRNSYERCYAHV